MKALSGGLLAAALLSALSFGQAEASLGSLTLNYSGTTDSSSTGGAGQLFSIHAVFSDVPSSTDTGFGIYAPSAISFTLGGTDYTVDSTHLGDYAVELLDPTNTTPFAGYYVPVLLGGGSLGVFAPVYQSSTTPGWDATAPTGTTFQNYLGSPSSSIVLETAGGNAVISTGGAIDASIPEPSSLALLLGGVAAAGVARRRRAAPAA